MSSIKISYSEMGLSWVLLCLQKAPYEPLHKASILHITIKTAFLLVLATARRCSEIHALAMDSNHLRFNQSDGSVSLIVQTGFLTKYTGDPIHRGPLFRDIQYIANRPWTPNLP